jgi:hypothetical protein
LAEKAVREHFAAIITRDTLRMAAKKYIHAAEVEPPQLVGKPGVLPLHIEEGLARLLR